MPNTPRLAVTAQDEPLLTAQDVAERLRCSRRYAYDLIAAGAFPVVRLGPRVVRVRAADLDAYISARIDAPRRSA